MDKKSFVDEAERSLLEIVNSGDRKIGDTLPNEKTLAATLKVSRSVIREALERLKLRGQIESRQKRGTIITQTDPVEQMISVLDPQRMDKTALLELMEMRLALEVGMADFIVKRATLQDQHDLRSLLAATDRVKEGSKIQKPFDLQEELNFHGKLYEIAGNQSVKKLLLGLIPIVHYIIKNTLQEDPPSFKKSVSHLDLIDLIASGSAEKLRKGLRQHLHGHYKRLFLAAG